MEDTKLIAKKRDLEGSSNARRLRKTGFVPAVVYGDEKEPVSVDLDTHAFGQLLHHHASESLLIDVEVEGEGTLSVLVKEVQHHPVSDDILHVDLMRVSANKPIAVDVSLELVGEAVGVQAGGVVDHVMHAIGVECLPGDLVEVFEVDISALEIGNALHVSDLNLGSKFKILVDGEAIVATVAAPKVEVEEDEEVAADASAEPEVITEKKAEEE